jgi:diaminopimelate decarboxylase
MNLPPHLAIRDDHLWIGEHDTVDLARTWGTPLYVTDQDRIAACFSAYREALSAEYSRVRVLYAAKANGNLAILRTLAGLGSGADVFSSGELHLALSAGMHPGSLLFNGNSKSRSDLSLAVEKGVTVSVDSLDELRQLDSVAAASGKTARIAFRVNPAVDVPTHPKIATGLATSKFGIAHNLVPSAYREALAFPHIDPIGIHCHIGSQILAVEPFARACDVMMRIVGEITRMGVRLEFVDLGGGLGIPYHRGEGEVSPTPADYARAVVPRFRDGIREEGISPELWIEPGRSLVADSTLLIAGVNSVKPAHRNFVNVDAGFNLLVRPAMYDSWHEVIAANKAGRERTMLYTIAGPICETGDILAHDRMLPGLSAGDLIAVLDAGAYGFAMSSQYNSRPRCPELLLKGPDAALMRRGEDVSDLTRTLQTPPWLETGS